ncbi:MAG: neutral/alkaline non-lysosomal ceramidase N-terminal domain-containing protein [Flavitalea sp.]
MISIYKADAIRFLKNGISFRYLKALAIIWSILLFTESVAAQKNKTSRQMIDVGVAHIDITPDGPILLAGYGERKTESEGVLQPLYAKALAFGNDAQGVSVLITVDLIGIQWYMTKQLAEILAKKTGLSPSQFVICTAHVHSGPEVGNLINHFSRQLPPEEIGHIDLYLEQLAIKLEKVATEAIHNRKPAHIAWGQGKATFAMNRRRVVDGKSVNMTAVPEGPVDNALPMMRITDAEGNLKAIFVSYACHGTTLGGDVNKIHGDWIGEAERLIEEKHPGVTALVALGCGADANPEPRLKMEYATQHGQQIADEVDRLLTTTLTPITSAPAGRLKMIELPFQHVPTVQEFVEQTKEKGSKGYFAKLALDKIARGEVIPATLSYPVMTWTFGKELAMVFLAGEVVVDYSLRLKKELGADRLWVNAYSNDVPCYIASARVIREGGYEVDYSMYSYNKPSRFSEGIEGLIIAAVYELLPASYKTRAKN